MYVRAESEAGENLWINRLHKGLNLFDPAALEELAGCKIRRENIRGEGLQRRSAAACQTLQGMLAGPALGIMGENLACPGINQPHVAGIGDASGQPDFRNQPRTPAFGA